LGFLRLLSALLVIYIILLSLRILLSWFREAVSGRPWNLLRQVTDPYLSLFSGLRFLRRGMFDFTPIAAILVLVVLLDLVNTVQRLGRITVGIFLGSLTGAVWSGISFLLWLFLILAVVRAVIQAVRRGEETPVTGAIALMVSPAVSVVRRMLSARRHLSEQQYLLLTIAFLAGVLLLGGLAVRFLIRFFYALPL
jgi:YggT family protein